MTIRVVLADDEGLIRTALATLLPLEGDITVVAEASDGHQALAAFAEHQPDVLVLDLEMPGLDGLDVAGAVLAEHPDQPVLMLTRHARPGMLRSALRLGVRGFLGKQSAPDAIAEAIAHVAAGGRHVAPTVSAQALIDDCPLTEREKDVLRVASDGYSASDISRILHLAPGTVRNYLSSAIGKTHTTTRHDAARHAREQGWI
ncbi:response regulator transcription factor [Cellulomonas bogoriensis]|uniref:LuxR family transcriptional regulator n=1 Tax=Cellulomonas bogoriensis 69B4 = DSM 16987 TaxID=1386082 RepID=A0A0A0C157_9CELL|nr:response regulator transcription factor [Cellulomonas bogoriensis]KGM13124.1 LuxR family transcriptional regulator [Cellulomonas bogoriensis 69B4 = DSM 16987]